MKIAAIDLGSNVAQLVIATKDETQKISFENYQQVTSLGEKTKTTGVISDEALNRTLNVLTSFLPILRQHGIHPSNVFMMATEACRLARNCANVFKKIQTLNYHPKLLLAHEEAYYAVKGVVSEISDLEKKITVLDIGGASTELTVVEISPFKIMHSKSFAFGTLEVSEWIELKDDDQKITAFINQYLNEWPLFNNESLYCAFGAMTTLFNMTVGNKNSVEDSLPNFCLDVKTIQEKLKVFMTMDKDQLLSQYPYVAPRIKTLPAAIKIAYHLIDVLKPKKLVLSSRGLAHGVLLENLAKV